MGLGCGSEWVMPEPKAAEPASRTVAPLVPAPTSSQATHPGIGTFPTPCPWHHLLPCWSVSCMCPLPALWHVLTEALLALPGLLRLVFLNSGCQASHVGAGWGLHRGRLYQMEQMGESEPIDMEEVSRPGTRTRVV